MLTLFSIYILKSMFSRDTHLQDLINRHLLLPDLADGDNAECS